MRTFSSATSRSAVTMSLLSESTSGRAPFKSCFARRAASSTSSNRLGTLSRQSSTVIRAIPRKLSDIHGEGNRHGFGLTGGNPLCTSLRPMGFFARLLGSGAARRDLLAELLEDYRAEMEQAVHLRHHADLARYPQVAARLRELAEVEERHGALLRDHILGL